MKEITIILKYKDEQELSKLLHQVHHNVRLGVKEMDNDTNTKFRLHDKNDLPVFETSSTKHINNYCDCCRAKNVADSITEETKGQ